MKKIAIIGGGAAGLTAAVSAACAAKAACGESADGNVLEQISIAVFEADERIGKSILASGNGRCNFSNTSVDSNVYYNASFVQESFEELPSPEVLDFFNSLGLLWHEEGEGRLYPQSNKASSVLDVLRFALDDLGVEIRCGVAVHSVTSVKGQYLLCLADSTTAFFDGVIIACGGKVARSLMPTTYLYHNTEPLLGPLKTTTDAIKGLNNIRARCKVTCGGHEELGEVLFREYGLSGIAIFNLSRYAKRGDSLSLDFFPQFNSGELQGVLEKRYRIFPDRPAVNFLAGMLQQPLARAVLKTAKLSPEKPLQPEGLSALGKVLKNLSVEVEGIGDYRQCQVQRGGFDAQGFEPKTLESKSDEGLFVVGEALDIDAPCGGFNLHWAWTSGILAGRAAVAQVSSC